MSVKSAPPPGVSSTRINLYELERGALRDLLNLVEVRASAEAASRAANAGAVAAAERDLARARKQVASGREQNLGGLQVAREEGLQQINQRYNSEMRAAEDELAGTKKRVATECDEVEQKARTAFQDARGTAGSLFDEAE